MPGSSLRAGDSRLGSGRGMVVGISNTIGRWFDSKAESYTEVIGFGMKLVYFPDRTGIPNLSTNLEFPISKK